MLAREGGIGGTGMRDAAVQTGGKYTGRANLASISPWRGLARWRRTRPAEDPKPAQEGYTLPEFMRITYCIQMLITTLGLR